MAGIDASVQLGVGGEEWAAVDVTWDSIRLG